MMTIVWIQNFLLKPKLYWCDHRHYDDCEYQDGGHHHDGGIDDEGDHSNHDEGPIIIFMVIIYW